jgi:hypothetical protein
MGYLSMVELLVTRIYINAQVKIDATPAGFALFRVGLSIERCKHGSEARAARPLAYKYTTNPEARHGRCNKT